MKIFWKLLLAVAVVITIGILLPIYSNVNQFTPTTLTEHRIWHLGSELWRYADDHGGNFPPQLSDLQADQLPDSDEILQFRDPTSKTAKPWLYFAGHSINDSPETIIAAAPVTTGNEKRGIWSVVQRRVIWTAARRTEAILDSEFQERLKAQSASQ
jgi:hypothetical protein